MGPKKSATRKLNLLHVQGHDRRTGGYKWSLLVLPSAKICAFCKSGGSVGWGLAIRLNDLFASL